MKIVVRLLDAAGKMLGWQEVAGKMPGDGTFTVAGEVPVDEDGMLSTVSIHWCEMNTEYRFGFNPVEVKKKTMCAISPIVIRVGEKARGLTPVTTRGSVVIQVPVGSLAATGN